MTLTYEVIKKVKHGYYDDEKKCNKWQYTYVNVIILRFRCVGVFDDIRLENN